MKKTRLDVDALAVESFGTEPARGARGTAFAHAAALVTQVDPCLTCELSCPNGCGDGESVQAIQGWPQEPIPTGWGDTCIFLAPCTGGVPGHCPG
jgi:hypothetical protein